MTKMRKCPDCKCWRTPTPHYGRPSCLSCQVCRAVPLSLPYCHPCCPCCHCHFHWHCRPKCIVIVILLSLLSLPTCIIALIAVDRIHHNGDVATRDLLSLRATLNDTLSQARQIFCCLLMTISGPPGQRFFLRSFSMWRHSTYTTGGSGAKSKKNNLRIWTYLICQLNKNIFTRMLLSHCSTNCCCPLNSSKANCCCPMNSSKKMVSGSLWLLDLLQKWINWTLMKEEMDSRQSIQTLLRPMTDWILWLRPINILLSLFQCNQSMRIK